LPLSARNAVGRYVISGSAPQLVSPVWSRNTNPCHAPLTAFRPSLWT
jgi:hypothetical protein